MSSAGGFSARSLSLMIRLSDQSRFLASEYYFGTGETLEPWHDFRSPLYACYANYVSR